MVTIWMIFFPTYIVIILGILFYDCFSQLSSLRKKYEHLNKKIQELYDKEVLQVRHFSQCGPRHGRLMDIRRTKLGWCEEYEV